MMYLLGMLVGVNFVSFAIVYVFFRPRYFHRKFEKMPISLFLIYMFIIDIVLLAVTLPNAV